MAKKKPMPGQALPMSAEDRLTIELAKGYRRFQKENGVDVTPPEAVNFIIANVKVKELLGSRQKPANAVEPKAKTKHKKS